MDTAALWQRYQDWLYYHEGLKFYLDVSRMGFDQTFVEGIKPKFEQAFKDMAALEEGAIANPDENRMVGHYWLRNPDLAPNSQLQKEILNTLEQIEDFTQKIHSGAILAPGGSKFTDILSIGIGGSALGPQFVAEALAPVFPPLAIQFIDNTDPAGIDAVLARIQEPTLQHSSISNLQVWGYTRNPQRHG